MHDHPDAPRDLDSKERVVAAWFQALDRPDAPAGLREAVVVHPRDEQTRQKTGRPAGRLLKMVPFGAWGIASAALILVAFGAAVAVELTTPVPGTAPQATPVAGVESDSSFIVRRDQTLSLYHDLEIFDEVGLPQGEVLADWGR